MKRTSMLVGGISAAWLVAMAGAQPALVTVNTTLAPGATVIRDATTNTDIPLATADITVRGVTLTMNGEHAIRSLTLERSACIRKLRNRARQPLLLASQSKALAIAARDLRLK